MTTRDGFDVEGDGRSPSGSNRRRNDGLLSVAVILAIGVNTDGRREVLGLDIGTPESEPTWTELPRAG